MKNNFLTKIANRSIETLFSISGAISGITILFITIFLFVEGIGLFNSSGIGKGYSLYMNSSNPVYNLSAEEIKNIFDLKVKNWNEVGGNNQTIKVFRLDDIFKIYPELEREENYDKLPELLSKTIITNSNIIAYLPSEYISSHSQGIREVEMQHISLSDFFLGKEWIPTGTPVALFGIMPLLIGTLLVSVLSIIIAVPFSLGVAIYLSEIANKKLGKLMKAIVELLAGIPSVVYGFFGLVVLAPLVQSVFNLPVGETALTGSLLLAIMALPTIITVAEDALRNTPKEMREASLAIGATKWQTIYRVVIPYSKTGIITAIVLGIGRAVGETMAVLMVTGNAAVVPNSVFDSVRTIPATIAAELGEAPKGGTHYQSLFLLASVLFLITLSISVISELISKKQKGKFA